ncbi:hemolysin family protein [Paenibacillus physcomitrellae]|uniref:Membrane protein n=1 Tax=Paenibacillus physcomitrellae TaxID=1619311 RepID=A0ABQ1GKU3_9BACL|nr:hemolysin family protein [Paenibacillus physcomitrellae]GGA45564.1 membrane protein [Paenibacillus physcomitrellae]
MDSDRLGLKLVMVVLLIGLSAFFVAVEFAAVRMRQSRVDQLIAEGKRNALAVKKVLNHLDGYLSACQLGITITSLGLGFLGESTVEKLLHPVFHALHLPESVNGVISLILAFAIITYFHVVVGELAPKTVAIRKTEMIMLLTAGTIIWFNRIMFPFIWLLNGSANLLVKLFGIKPASEHEEAHSEEELQIILSESFESGKINQAEYGYVSRIFAFDNMLAKEIMVPRTDMICLYTNLSREENLTIIKEQQYTRFPVVKNNKDHVIGIINTKQFFLEYDDEPDLDLSTLLQPVLSVAETMPVNDLLKKMQKERTHIAILIDEYGGTSGMVTIEDILEEIVGEIRDEFDAEEEESVRILDEDHIIVDGKLSINQLSRYLPIELDDEEWDTIGGWLYAHQDTLDAGEGFWYEGYLFTVLEREKTRYLRIEIQSAPANDEDAGPTVESEL